MVVRDALTVAKYCLKRRVLVEAALAAAFRNHPIRPREHIRPQGGGARMDAHPRQASIELSAYSQEEHHIAATLRRIVVQPPRIARPEHVLLDEKYTFQAALRRLPRDHVELHLLDLRHPTTCREWRAW